MLTVPMGLQIYWNFLKVKFWWNVTNRNISNILSISCLVMPGVNLRLVSWYHLAARDEEHLHEFTFIHRNATPSQITPTPPSHTRRYLISRLNYAASQITATIFHRVFLGVKSTFIHQNPTLPQRLLSLPPHPQRHPHLRLNSTGSSITSTPKTQ